MITLIMIMTTTTVVTIITTITKANICVVAWVTAAMIIPKAE